ncbi:MAG: hypothetical protein Q7T18_02605, partial [Sedimentisphaerales bacterium]|nr:hypothetical protein [Sedimentisphaerales bacterium]
MCTITKHLEIRFAKRAAYDQLAHFHYRSSCPAVYAAIYAMYDTSGWHGLSKAWPWGMGGMARRERSDRGHVQGWQPPKVDGFYERTQKPVGVIVYTMPVIGLEVRNIAIGEMFECCQNRKERMKMINENIRCISRVIIEPRYRGLGLAARLVRETMPLLNVPIIEAMAVMGQVNPFFEKAGMT